MYYVYCLVIWWHNYLTQCITRSSAAREQTVKGKRVLVLHEKRVLVPVPFQCTGMIWNTNTYSCFLTSTESIKCNMLETSGHDRPSGDMTVIKTSHSTHEKQLPYRQDRWMSHHTMCCHMSSAQWHNLGQACTDLSGPGEDVCSAKGLWEYQENSWNKYPFYYVLLFHIYKFTNKIWKQKIKILGGNYISISRMDTKQLNEDLWFWQWFWRLSFVRNVLIYRIALYKRNIIDK